MFQIVVQSTYWHLCNANNMSNWLSRVRGWWVRGLRRGRALWTSRAPPMMDRRGVWSQRGGRSSHLTWPRETQHHRSDSHRTLLPASTLTHSPLPLFILTCCTDVFYIDMRHVVWPIPSIPVMEHNGLLTGGGRGLWLTGVRLGRERVANRAVGWTDALHN